MPYITQKERRPLNPVIQELFNRCMKGTVDPAEVKGRINFCITKLVHLWTIEYMRIISSKVKKYKILNDAWGIISGAAEEFYMAVVLPYEKLKQSENGAISQLDATADGQKV